ncbi:cyclin-like protein [Phlyctochytrium arcticum]|nr:cyclin-like protein [Phlyctochytrium arcticum]
MAVLSESSSTLSLRNPILTLPQLENSPSRQDGLSAEHERELRVFGCELIQSAGILLRLPQVAMATAQILFQRFYYVASFKLVALRDIVMGAVFLAAKVEETPRRIRDIINVFCWLFDTDRGRDPKVETYAGLIFNDLKDGIINGELHILCKLGFNIQVQQPHGFMMNYLQGMNLVDNEELAQKAWNYMNDGLRTHIYVCYQPSTIACAVIFLAARVCRVKLPTDPPWWKVFDAELEDLENIAGHILYLYEHPRRKGLPLTLSETEKFVAMKGQQTFRAPPTPRPSEPPENHTHAFLTPTRADRGKSALDSAPAKETSRSRRISRSPSSQAQRRRPSRSPPEHRSSRHRDRSSSSSHRRRDSRSRSSRRHSTSSSRQRSRSRSRSRSRGQRRRPYN